MASDLLTAQGAYILSLLGGSDVLHDELVAILDRIRTRAHDMGQIRLSAEVRFDVVIRALRVLGYRVEEKGITTLLSHDVVIWWDHPAKCCDPV